jgi:hypothetical protein
MTMRVWWGGSWVADQQALVHDHWSGVAGVSRYRAVLCAGALDFRWSSSPSSRATNALQYRGNHSVFVLGRMKPGLTAAQATADLNALGAWLSKTYPADDEGVKFTLARPGLVG